MSKNKTVIFKFYISDCCFNLTLKQSDTKAPEFIIVVLRMAFTVLL